MPYLGNYLGIDLAQNGLGINLAPRSLPFGYGTFANTGERTLLAKNSSNLYVMTGPFAANVLATRQRNGKTYGLFAEQYATTNIYSEQAEQWSLSGMSGVNQNILASPIGELTVDQVVENSSAGNHFATISTSVVTGNQYYFVLFIMPISRTRGLLQFSYSDFVGSPFTYYNLSTKTFSSQTNLDDYGMLELSNGMICLYISATCDHTNAASYVRDYFADSGGSISYTGDGASYQYLWGANVVKAEHWTNYIKAVASPVTKPADVFYWSNAALPTWLKGSTSTPFSFKFIPNYSSTQHASIGTNTFLFSVDGTENVECYISGADQKLYIDVDSVNKFTSASAFAWDMHDNPAVTIIPNNGSNCRVITSGFTSGNADETGTLFSMQSDGNLHWAQRHTTNDLHLNGLQSEPWMGYV